MVVGDVIDIQQGDIISADVLLIEALNLHVDESRYDSKSKNVKKAISIVNEEEDNHKENPDPFLLTGSLVLTG